MSNQNDIFFSTYKKYIEKLEELCHKELEIIQKADPTASTNLSRDLETNLNENDFSVVKYKDYVKKLVKLEDAEKILKEFS